jgi:hypothetical protein
MTTVTAITERDIKFPSGPLTLAGTLALPAVTGPAPAVLLLPGSGQTDRDDNARKLALNVFPPLSQAIARCGIVTLRYDKRGVGASQGDYWSTGFDDRLADAAAALTWLRAQPDVVDPRRIFVLGHSEGALIAVRLAAHDPEIAGVILLAGSARTGEQTLLWQGDQIARTLTGVNRWLVDHLSIDPGRQQRKAIQKIRASSAGTVRVQGIQKVNVTWFREFLAYDPQPDLAAVQAPVLAITGEKDIQVDPADLARMAELVPGDFESRLLPGLTHLLRAEAGEPGLRTYRDQVRRPVDDRVINTVLAWLQEKTRGHRPQA